MNNKLRIASCLLGAIATIGLAQEAKAITFSEGVGNPALFGPLGLNGGTGIPDSLLDTSFGFAETNFTNESPANNVRTFATLQQDGEIPSNAILDSVNVFLFGELDTIDVAFENRGTQPADITAFDIAAELDLDLSGARIVVAIPTVDALQELGPNGSNQLPNPIPGNTPQTLITTNLPMASDAGVQNLSGADLNPFLQLGTVDFDIDGDNITYFSSTGGAGSGSARVEGFAEYAIEYNFSIPSQPIPFETESGVAVVAVSGLIAYRQLRKRRQS